ncbi:MAG: hypothetical protein JWM08_1599 [Candidatus Angelobacter sp.]|nr:hypothetical protein [Candidatus Angelobacter sp.]
MIMHTITTKARQFTPQFQYSIITVILMGAFSMRALAQDGHSHVQTTQHQEQAADQKSQASALLKIVRDSTERFKDVKVAELEGYTLTFGCVSGPDAGAMGLHFVNFDLVTKGELDARRPQIVIYEPTSDGQLRLIGADYLLDAATWDAKKQGPPELMGQLFHLFDSPNRFGLPAFYTLHVWAWKENPNGAFVNWHPNVSCQNFSGQTTF